MAEGRDWAAVCIAPVIRRETSSPFQVIPVHKESPGRVTASFELSVPPNPITNSGDLECGHECYADHSNTSSLPKSNPIPSPLPESGLAQR